MKGSDFIFDYVDLLHQKCHKIILNHNRSYIDCPDWMKNKKEEINHINKGDNKRFQYTATLALNHEETGENLKRI